VIAQHIPEMFSTSFARRLNSLSAVTVYEAEHDQPVDNNCAYLAPGHSHLKLVCRSGKYVCQLDQRAPVNRHRPSVEVLFDSVGVAAGGAAMAVLLTGMGKRWGGGTVAFAPNGCVYSGSG
jgi:two-component system chemotaxis response regulator CheB